MAKKRVLFICTGNYYRSRFAEGLFNYEAAQRGLDWCAFSRALALDQLLTAAGPISHHAQSALESRGVPLWMTGQCPKNLEERDLRTADLVFAIKEDEHRPYMRRRFPFWEDKIQYWGVSDIDRVLPQEALPQVAAHIKALLDRLQKDAG